MTAVLPGLLVAAAASLTLNSSDVIRHALVSSPAIRAAQPAAAHGAGLALVPASAAGPIVHSDEDARR